MSMKVSSIIQTLAPLVRDGNKEEAEAIARLRRAHKFSLQLSGDAAIAAKDYAHQLNEFGLFCLPFPETYFEVNVSDEEDGGWTAGVLCWAEGDKFFGRIYLWRPTGCKTCEVTIDLLGFRKKSDMSVLHAHASAAPYWRDTAGVFGTRDEEDARVSSVVGATFAYIGVGSLTLVGASRTPVAAPAALNKTRVRKGKEPIYSHTVVRVAADPGRVGGFSLGSLDRAPVRLHWRRGHIRRLASGKLTQVRPCLVGDRTAGIVSHDYEVRA